MNNGRLKLKNAREKRCRYQNQMNEGTKKHEQHIQNENETRKNEKSQVAKTPTKKYVA